jgi:hypothetical protein
LTEGERHAKITTYPPGRFGGRARNRLRAAFAFLETYIVTNVYIDGFNFYYGALKKTPYRWINVRKLCELLLPKNTVAEIKYFTALVVRGERTGAVAGGSNLASGPAPPRSQSYIFSGRLVRNWLPPIFLLSAVGVGNMYYSPGIECYNVLYNPLASDCTMAEWRAPPAPYTGLMNSLSFAK